MCSLSKWEWFKFKVKQIAIKKSKQSSTLKKIRQRDIISHINTLCCKDDLTLEEQTELNNLQSHLDNIYLEKGKGAFIRSRARWIEEGEFFFFLVWKNKYRPRKKFRS